MDGMPKQFNGDKNSCGDNRYEKLLQSIYDALLITSVDGTILEFNSRALEYLRCSSGDVLGSSILKFLSGANTELLHTVLHNLEDHRYTVVEAHCLRHDGTTFQSEIAINRIDLHGHDELCFLIRDISVRYKAQQDLKHALERMEAISRQRIEFVSNVSHELRTPLTSMIYAVRNMQNGHAGILGDRAMQYLERLDSDCRRLLGTVNDILDLRQIENNTLVLTKTKAPIRAIVQNAADSLRVQSDAKQISMPLHFADVVNFVECDVQKTERIFINLIGNAIKFTPSGGEIAVSVARSEQDPGKVTITVSDTGIGIPKESLEKVTARYYQVGEQPAGTGLGLSISKELAEMHGGSLRIESPVPGTDKGTRVTVNLPIVAPPRVLLVSRDCAEAQKLKAICDHHNIPCDHQTSGHAAIRLCTSNCPKTVILCEETDDMPAGDVAVQLKNNRRLSALSLLLAIRRQPSSPITTVGKAFRIPTVDVDADNSIILNSILKALS